jgi:hypothetical protein
VSVLGEIREGLLLLEDAMADSQIPYVEVERVAVFALAVRGWKFLAGESQDNLEMLVRDIADCLGELALKRLEEREAGRPEGSLSGHTADRDLLVHTDIEAGMSVRAAIKKHYPSDPEGVHERRIKRQRAARKAAALKEELAKIELQTPGE